MTIVTATPYPNMTLPELRAEHAQWVAATRPGGPMANLEPAHCCRDIVATWIARREREEMAAAGTAKDFSCQDCGTAVEMLAPVRRDAPDLRCTCGGALVADELAAASVAA